MMGIGKWREPFVIEPKVNFRGLELAVVGGFEKNIDSLEMHTILRKHIRVGAEEKFFNRWKVILSAHQTGENHA